MTLSGEKNTLSLFHGMGVGDMVIKSLTSDYNMYYSEIDKHADLVSSELFPESTQLGDVRKIEVESLPKIDMLLGGSPCQSFSFSGKGEGMTTETKEEVLTLERYLELKSLNFKFKGQSYLFWEYIRVLKDVQRYNPEVEWLLENVEMPKKWETLISQTLGVQPIRINSQLVSGQCRKRLYWTNINSGKIPNPIDLHVDFHDILEENTKINSAAIRGRRVNQGTIVGRRVDNNGVRKDNNKQIPITQCIEVRKNNINKTNCITTVKKDNVLTNLSYGRHLNAFTEYIKDIDWRYLTAKEALRLQTIPEEYIEIILKVVSENQAYKMAGNGWTFLVIKHILSHSKYCK